MTQRDIACITGCAKYRNRRLGGGWHRGVLGILRGYSREKYKKIQEYIQKQPEEDKAGERLPIGNY